MTQHLLEWHPSAKLHTGGSAGVTWNQETDEVRRCRAGSLKHPVLEIKEVHNVVSE